MTQKKFWHRLFNIDPVRRTADCSICGQVKVYKTSRTPCGKRNYRYDCSNKNKEERKTWRTNNFVAYSLATHKQHLKSYRISEQDFLNILKFQNNKCAVCGKDATYFKTRLHVDHDHACCPGPANSCGKCIRGLVCYRCNIFLGNIDSGLLKKALAYLDMYNQRREKIKHA